MFLSTPSARRATKRERRRRSLVCCFYPRPPRGGRLSPLVVRLSSSSFLSTPSARRATGNACHRVLVGQRFYPRPPRGGRPGPDLTRARGAWFLSTPSARRATTTWRTCAPSLRVSIHALREEGDASRCCCGDVGPCFYPRPPRGGRPVFTTPDTEQSKFLSTPSARRATSAPARVRRPRYPSGWVSIHALREEGDCA